MTQWGMVLPVLYRPTLTQGNSSCGNTIHTSCAERLVENNAVGRHCYLRQSGFLLAVVEFSGAIGDD